MRSLSKLGCESILLYWGVLPAPVLQVAAVESRFGCSFPAANQEGLSSLCMLGRGIYEADTIWSGSSSSSVAPTFRVATPRRPGAMAYLAMRCSWFRYHAGPEHLNSDGDPVSDWVLAFENRKLYCCLVGSQSEERH